MTLFLRIIRRVLFQYSPALARHHEPVCDAMNGGNRRASDFGAVILLSGMRMGRVRAEAADYIKANDYGPNVVYVYTHTTEGSPYGKDGNVSDKDRIDAITSASVSRKSGGFFDVKSRIMRATMGEQANDLMKGMLERRGIPVVPETFSCRGKFLWMNRKRPNEADLSRARAYAERVAKGLR